MGDDGEHSSTSLFREYIRINTMHPNPDYAKCMKFLQGLAEKIGLPWKVTKPRTEI